ncbi:MAG: formate dehydrogenase accessory sulfurtransferase FdhD [Acidobacteriota bacterium]
MDSHATGRIAETADAVDTVVTQVRAVGGALHDTDVADRLIVEEPLSIRLDDTLVTTTMRTPGHDAELAVGFCFTEGLLHGQPVVGVGEPFADGRNTVTVRTDHRAPVPTPRLGTTSSSCGWCGNEQLEALVARLERVASATAIDRAVVMEVAATMRSHQELFGATGAAHCAAAFDDDANIVVIREDVGRHNAVDKVVGRLHLDGRTPVSGDWGLFVSGRASIEMVQKAWAAGFGTLIAVSAPTALAVEAARRAGMTLAGFVRAGGFNVYSPAP